MRELSERGRDTNLGKFLGMRGPTVVVGWPGIIVRANVCVADVHDLHLVERFLGMRGPTVVVGWPGIIVRANVCVADVHDLHLAERTPKRFWELLTD